MKKRIKLAVKPFNQFAFKSCFYHQLIAAYSHFGIDERMFLLNYLPVYRFDAKTKKLTTEDVVLFSDAQIGDLTGVRKVGRKRCLDPVAHLIRCIEEDTPVIVAVDSFLLPYRQDVYLQEHLRHFLLVDGFDREKKLFYTNEHWYLNSTQYGENTIGFRSLSRSFRSCARGLAGRGDCGLIELRRERERAFTIDSIDFKAGYAAHAGELEESRKAFGQAMDFVRETLKDEEKWRRETENLLEFFGVIRQRKYQEKYQLLLLWNDASLNEIINRVIEDYIFIYGVLIRTKMTKFNPESMEKVLGRCAELAELEDRLHRVYRGETI